MADSQTHTHTHTRFLNPWVLHLQKLGLELKCPSCLGFYKKPMLLPCNHMFCSSCCVPESNSVGLDCPICKLPYVNRDLREAPYVENLVNIYRTIDASFSMHMLNSEVGRGLVQYPFPGNSASGTTSVPVRGNERVLVPNSTSVGTTLERCNGLANNGLRPRILEHSFQGRSIQQEPHVALNVNMNQAELFPDSPPSSGDSKGVEIDSRDPERNTDTAGKCPSIKSSKRAADDFKAQGIDEHPELYSKKQKQTNPSLVASLPTGDRLAVESNSICVSNFTCAFCQTCKVTEGSGPMHHFANNGKQVFGNEAGRSNVVHLHLSCIEWTPQIYYEDDTTIRNVDKELARAEKLKCTSCGLKGAALGCFAKSCRRTYHAPCAYEVAECRWDTEDFLMLCPSHASQKFPSERSRKSAPKKPSSVKIHDEQKRKELCESDSWTKSSTGTQNWVLCASSLSADQKSMLVKFANLCGATVTRNWTPEVTHVIAATDANGACTRTLKVLMAILKGRWVLKTDWINACLEQKHPVHEEPYEINLDNHGCCDGPKTGRLRALNNEPMIFRGLKFYFSGDFISTYQDDLKDLIVAGGGIVIESREQLQECSQGQLNTGTTVIVYNDDIETGTGVVSTVLERQVEAEMVAAESLSQVVPHTWLLGSIASNRLQSFV